MATSTDYFSKLDIRLPLQPDTDPKDKSFKDIDGLFLAARLMAQEITNIQDNSIPDAPADGDTYGRKDNAWVPVSGGGGGGVQEVVAGTNITVDNTDPERPVVSATGGGGGTPEFIFVERRVLTSAVQDVSFTGLDLVADKQYKVKVSIPATAGTHYIRIFVNGDTNEANYYRTYLKTENTTVQAGASSNAYIFDMGNRSPGFPSSAEFVMTQIANQNPTASGVAVPIGATAGVSTVGMWYGGWSRLNTANVVSMVLNHDTVWPAGTEISFYQAGN